MKKLRLIAKLAAKRVYTGSSNFSQIKLSNPNHFSVSSKFFFKVLISFIEDVSFF